MTNNLACDARIGEGESAIVAKRASRLSHLMWRPIATLPENSAFYNLWCAPGKADSGTLGIGSRTFLTDGPIEEWRWSEITFHPLEFVPPLVFQGIGEKSASMTPTHWAPMLSPPKTPDASPTSQAQGD